VSGGGFAGWGRAHRAALGVGLRRLGARPLGSLLTVAVLALAIALPLCLGGLVKEADRFSGALRDSRDIAVFLDPALDETAARQLAARWEADPRVATVTVRSPDDGLAELRAQEGLAAALDALEGNPLPWVLLLVPRAGSDDHALAAALRTEAQVDEVQHDAAWRQRLAAWLGLAERLAWITAWLLGAALVLVVGNTVRLELQDQRDSVLTLRLLGATDAYVRRPFLYLGAAFGLAAGLLAVLLTEAASRALAPPLARLIDSYGGSFRLLLWSPAELAAVVALAGLLGVLGAWLAAGHHLRQAESAA
jgi:cell division transport system permease protein